MMTLPLPPPLFAAAPRRGTKAATVKYTLLTFVLSVSSQISSDEEERALWSSSNDSPGVALTGLLRRVPA